MIIEATIKVKIILITGVYPSRAIVHINKGEIFFLLSAKYNPKTTNKCQNIVEIDI